jgi:hypothetical protein
MNKRILLQTAIAGPDNDWTVARLSDSAGAKCPGVVSVAHWQADKPFLRRKSP